MSNKTIVVAGVTVILLLILFVKVYYDSSDAGGTLLGNTDSFDRLNTANRQFIEQRNNLSRILNMKQQKLGQMECEKGAKQATSESGGWCQTASIEGNGQHMTDKNLANALADFFKGKYVGSFGDGPGRYKQLLTDSGKLKAYDAYDGAPYCDVTSEGRVQFLDLTLPQYGLPLYDWIISLEVAEHIPEKFESIFVDNIVRHAKEGVVLSWAKLGQGGYSHVNNRAFEYVRDLMDKLGFFHDNEQSEILKSKASLPWLQWNTNVYRRKQSAMSQDMYNFT